MVDIRLSVVKDSKSIRSSNSDFRLMRSPSAVSSVFRVPFGLSPTPTLHPFRGNFRVGGHSLRTPNPVRQDEHHFGFGSLVQRRTHQSETGRKRLANHWEAKRKCLLFVVPHLHANSGDFVSKRAGTALRNSSVRASHLAALSQPLGGNSLETRPAMPRHFVATRHTGHGTAQHSEQ